MKENIYVNTTLAQKTYKATNIHSSFNYHIDYWLIGKGKEFVDAKRIAPILFLIFFILIAFFSLNAAKGMEEFSYLLTSETGSTQSRFEFIFWRLSSFWGSKYYLFFISGLLLAPIFFILGLHLLFSPYPCPVRFNQKNGLVYTKHFGRVWVTDWSSADIKIWRGVNPFLFFRPPYRGIQIRLFSIDKKGQWMQRWVILSAVDSHKIDDLAIGGDPSLLYWNWLNTYMQGASFDESDITNNAKANKIPNPKIGRLPVLEAVMRFRAYKFPNSIDERAIEIDQYLKKHQIYPDDEGDKLPNNPFFTWQYDFPERAMPDANGNIVEVDHRAVSQAIYKQELEQFYQSNPLAKKMTELEQTLADKKIDNSFKYYRLTELEAALASDNEKTSEEIELIKLYIEMGGYQYNE
jgi:hypothetical protein